jgi:hypothetical protein
MVKTEDVILAFLCQENKKEGHIESIDGVLKVYDRIIAKKERGYNIIKIFRSYSSKLIIRIMNKLPNVKINWENGGWYLNGEKWDSDEADIYIDNPEMDDKITSIQLEKHFLNCDCYKSDEPIIITSGTSIIGLKEKYNICESLEDLINERIHYYRRLIEKEIYESG